MTRRCHRTTANLHELLRIAQSEFKSVKTIDEDELKQDWPRLRAALGKAFRHFRPKKAAIINLKPKLLPPWRQQFMR